MQLWQVLRHVIDASSADAKLTKLVQELTMRALPGLLDQVLRHLPLEYTTLADLQQVSRLVFKQAGKEVTQ